MTPITYAVVLLAIIVTGEAASEQENRKVAEDYLRRYQYMGSQMADHLAELTHSNNSFEEAIKGFQQMAGIEMTGQITDETMEWMKKPRCGNPDYTGMGSIAKRRKRYVAQGSRWPKSEITYNFINFTTDLTMSTVKADIKRAFRFWTDVTPLTIYETSAKTADIEVRFVYLDHGDGNAFDGAGKVLAHAFFPQYGGDIHFDDAETWASNSPIGTDLVNVAVHELGHSLGLGHSNVKEAIMAPFYTGYKPYLKLHADDIEGIQYIYGAKTTVSATTTPRASGSSESGAQRTTPRRTAAINAWCNNAVVDATVSIDNLIYVFRGKEMLQLNNDYGIVSGYPKNISEVFYDLPNDLDAAMYWSENTTSTLNGRNDGSVYFFKDSMCWLYDKLSGGRFELVSGYPKSTSTVFIGLPDKLDAAFVWSGNGKPYFFKGDKYYRGLKGRIDIGFPRSLGAWKGLPKSGVDSAFSSQATGRTYFLKNDKYYRFNDMEFKVDKGYPKKTSEVWMGCSSSGIDMLEKEMLEGRDQFVTASSCRQAVDSAALFITTLCIMRLFINI